MSAEHEVTAFSKNQPKERQLRPVLVTVRIAGPAKEQPYSNLPTRIFIGLIGRQAPHIRAAALEPALRALVLPQGIGQVWMAGEALVVRRMRDFFMHQRGIARPMMHVSGYCKLGEETARDTESN